jgi:hypothetical protein
VTGASASTVDTGSSENHTGSSPAADLAVAPALITSPGVGPGRPTARP